MPYKNTEVKKEYQRKYYQDNKEKILKRVKYTRKYLETSAKFKDELAKCILVCVICHRKLHLNGEEKK